MSRLKKLKLENIKKANELLDKGHISQYPSQEQLELKPSDNVTNSSKSFINKMNNLKEEEDLGGMTSDPRIMAREYGNIPESPEAKAAEQIFKLFDHKIGGWTISPDHRVTQETNDYLAQWKETAKSKIEVLINHVVSDYEEQKIDNELENEKN